MSFLQNTALLHGRAHAGPAKSPTAQPAGLPALQSRSSIAALVGLVRNPAGAVGDVVDGWLDGLTKAEREQRQCVEDKKHVQYLKMRNVQKPTASWRQGPC
jgi:cell division inhibitor SulA